MDAQHLKKHLAETVGYILRLRELMTPGNHGYSDAPASRSFGPKSPCNEYAMDLADMEAAFIGNLAKYCITMGSIPPHSLRGLWFINGECKGIHTNGLATLPQIINHLLQHIEEILNTERTQDLLKAGEETRWYTKRTLPNEQKETWITQKQAEEYTGRTRWALWQWRKEGTIRHHKDEHGTIYLKADLDLMLEIKRGNQIRGMKGWTQTTTDGSTKNKPTPQL